MTIFKTENTMPDSTSASPRTLSIAYTPDSDDVFNFYAWEHDRVTLKGIVPRFERSHIAVLNRAAQSGLFDVVAVSSVVYPFIADRYWILAAGTSVGRGYGPVLVSKNHHAIEELKGKRVGVADLCTTGGRLAQMYCPEGVEFVAMPYNTIAESILKGQLDAGVMIHEELVHFPELGLHRVRDLGAAWMEDTKLPLPVGLNLVKKSVGRETAQGITRTCQESLRWAREHQAESMTFANRFGRGCAADFVPMFSNDDTMCMPEDVRAGLVLLFDRLAQAGWAPAIKNYEIIDA